MTEPPAYLLRMGEDTRSAKKVMAMEEIAEQAKIANWLKAIELLSSDHYCLAADVAKKLDAMVDAGWENMGKEAKQ
jgi:hypothetical protein